jgi:hypothetical protein
VKANAAKPHANTTWVKAGVMVQHKTFGIGTIKRVSGDYITIEFQNEEKKFAFPDSFDNGFLTKPDTSEQLRFGAFKSSAQSASTSKKSGSSSTLYSRLISSGFACIDNRGSSSILWVIYSVDKKSVFEKITAEFKAQYKLEMRGSFATDNKPAWRIML